MNLPSISQTFYYQCYGKANATAPLASAGVSTIEGAYTDATGQATATVTAATTTTSGAHMHGLIFATAGALAWLTL